MIDPYTVTIFAVLGTVLIIGMFQKNWISVIATTGATLLFLGGITHSAGYPTNTAFPSHAIVYGLTPEHVWAAPKDNPYPPRAYIFKAPPEWFDERDRVAGQPFEVEKLEGEKNEDGTESQNRSDRTSYGEYMIHRHTLPPKEE